MGLFGWGQQDTSTPQERAAWKERAQEQIDEQDGTTTEPEPEPGGPARHVRHVRKRGLFS